MRFPSYKTAFFLGIFPATLNKPFDVRPVGRSNPFAPLCRSAGIAQWAFEDLLMVFQAVKTGVQ